MKKLFYITFLVTLSLSNGLAQNNPTIDSLKQVLKTAKHDTTRINTYNKLSWEYKSSKPDTAMYFANSALNLAIKADYKNGMANSYNNIGLIHANKGDYDNAIAFYLKSLKIAEGTLSKAKDLSEKQSAQKGMAASYNNIGNIHLYKGDYDNAIAFYLKSLKKFEELRDKQGMSVSYNNIGIIYDNKGDYDKAIAFYFKSLDITEYILSEAKELSEKQNAQKGMSNSFANIGIIYEEKGDYDKAIAFYFKSLKIDEELGNKNGMSISYDNIGIIYYYKGDYDKAIAFYFKSLQLREELGDQNGMSTSYNNIGNLYLTQNKPIEAKKQQLQALNIALEIGHKESMYYAYSSLAQCDSALGNFRGAYEYYKLYSQVHDSVFTKESSDKIAEMGAKYEAEKRELTIQKLEKEKLLQNETLARKEAESKKQRILLFSFLAGFLIILVFSIFLYQLFVQKKMANVLLEQQKEAISTQKDEIETQRDLVTQQKEKIEEKQKEILDSIRYAKRIQDALLTSQKYIERNLKRLRKND